MDRNLVKQIKLSKDEKVFYDFNKLKGKNSDCRILLTTKRLIIYNDGVYYQNKRKIRKKGINEIQRNTITRVEYYLEFIKSHYIAKMVGLILFILGALVAVLNFGNSVLLPVVSTLALTALGKMILINDLVYYVPSAILMLFSLILILKSSKSLNFRVVSGHQDEYMVQLRKNKYNEEAIKRISTKLYVN